MRGVMSITHNSTQVNNISLHYASSGSGQPIIFLHGFPEFWYVWRKQLPFFGLHYHAIAPDLRGYHHSEKPVAIAAYQLPTLVKDIAELIRSLGQQQAILIGHDWGGVIAWECARIYPELLEKLIIINAPHPHIFRRELANNPAQQAASAYIPRLRSQQAETILAANNYAALQQIVLAPGLEHGYFDQHDVAAYMHAWAQPGALSASLNYYRANDFLPGMPYQQEAAQPIRVPTCVIWGEADDALLVGNLIGLEEHVEHLTIVRVPAATHAIIHEQPAMINAQISQFLT
jgi:epoxide hydrolase 4